MTTTLRNSPALRAEHSSRRPELYLVIPAKQRTIHQGISDDAPNFLRVFTAPSINFEISAASPSVKSPSETASRIAALAATASAKRSILGRSTETGRSRRTGAILSRMIFAAGHAGDDVDNLYVSAVLLVESGLGGLLLGASGGLTPHGTTAGHIAGKALQTPQAGFRTRPHQDTFLLICEAFPHARPSQLRGAGIQ
jgi:hypothetical protein